MAGKRKASDSKTVAAPFSYEDCNAFFNECEDFSCFPDKQWYGIVKKFYAQHPSYSSCPIKDCRSTKVESVACFLKHRHGPFLPRQCNQGHIYWPGSAKLLKPSVARTTTSINAEDSDDDAIIDGEEGDNEDDDKDMNDANDTFDATDEHCTDESTLPDMLGQELLEKYAKAMLVEINVMIEAQQSELGRLEDKRRQLLGRLDTTPPSAVKKPCL